MRRCAPVHTQRVCWQRPDFGRAILRAAGRAALNDLRGRPLRSPLTRREIHLTSNVAQSYPYTTETEVERVAAIERATTQFEGLATKIGDESTPIDDLEPDEPGRPESVVGLRMPRTRHRSPSRGRVRARDDMLCTSCATKAARPICAEAPPMTTPDPTPQPDLDPLQPVRQRSAADAVLHPLRRSAQRRVQRRRAVRQARDRFAAAPNEPVRTVALISTLFPQLPRAEMRMFRVAFLVGAGIILVLTLLGFFPVALVISARARAAADGPVRLRRRHLRGRADLDHRRHDAVGRRGRSGLRARRSRAPAGGTGFGATRRGSIALNGVAPAGSEAR